MTKRTDTATGSRGGVRRPRTPGQTWSYFIDLGLQDAQRCNGCGRRHWVGARALTACPRCGDSLRSTSERRTLEVSGYQTERDAKFARAEAVARIGRGDFRPPQRLTLAAYLRDVWLPEMRAEGLKSTTVESYERIVADHFIGPNARPFALGSMQLNKVTQSAIQQHYKTLAAGYAAERGQDGNRRLVERKGLSASSIRRSHAVLHRALEVAMTRHRLIDRNPAQGAARKLPADAPDSRRVVSYWEPAELQRFLAFTHEAARRPGADELAEVFALLWYVFAHTGMRRGEALGLRHEDLAGASLTVKRSRVPLKGGIVEETTTKTGRQRTIDLDAETVRVLDRVASLQKRWRLKAGPAWQESGYVFTDSVGAPLDPAVVSWQFRAAIAAANADAADPETPPAVTLSPLSVHGLRHTHATIALQAGIPVTVVSNRLGHVKTTMTWNVYSHVLKGAQADLAATFAKVVQRGAF